MMNQYFVFCKVILSETIGGQSLSLEVYKLSKYMGFPLYRRTELLHHIISASLTSNDCSIIGKSFKKQEKYHHHHMLYLKFPKNVKIWWENFCRGIRIIKVGFIPYDYINIVFKNDTLT